MAGTKIFSKMFVPATPFYSGEPRGSSKGVQTGIVAQTVVH